VPVGNCLFLRVRAQFRWHLPRAAVWCCRGLAHEKLGNLDQAVQALRQAAQLQPGNEGVTTALNRCAPFTAAAATLLV
jgi:cytochrome c-type biogenesis protein CcmH/NrfG